MTRTISRLFIVCAMAAMFASAHRASAETVADFLMDFTGPTPATGWSYSWNPTGYQIGDRAHYAGLTYGPAFDWQNNPIGSSYTVTGRWPAVASGDGQYIGVAPGLSDTTAPVHPGLGSQQSSDGYDHAAIAAYTIQAGEAGSVSIVNSLIARPAGAYAGGSTGSDDLFVYVNDTLKKSVLGVNTRDGVSFDCSLGNLNAGDTVYVAVGPHGSNTNDNAWLSFGISSTAVPEPSSLFILVSALIGLVAYAWRKR